MLSTYIKSPKDGNMRPMSEADRIAGCPGEEVTVGHYDKFCTDSSAERSEFQIVCAYEATTSFRNKRRLEVLISEDAESVVSTKLRT